MKVVFVSQWYPPEQAPIGYMIRELAQAMTAAGHDVTVITGFPNHPSGVVFGGYRKRLCLNEVVDGVKLCRTYLYTKRSPGKFSRILTFLSFTLTSGGALLFGGRRDLIFAVFQPLSVGMTLPIIAKLKRSKLILNVQDLHPDVPVELGLVKNPLFVRVLRWVERTGYRSAAGLAVICEQFKAHCVGKGADAGDVAVIPNWIDLSEVVPGDRMNSFRAELGLSRDHLVVLYAGTIGMVSGAEVVLRAATILGTTLPAARFVFVGEGPAVAGLRTYVEENGLGNVLFVPFQPRERLAEVQATADISLVTLLKGKGRSSVPSKVLGYMAAARAVIASVDSDSETASLVRRSGCGIVVDAEDGTKLADAIVSLATDSARRNCCGESGRRHLEGHYAKATVTGRYIEFFETVAGRT
ncbi:glycosyltransferase family 4 protein [Aromatoleum sp.]|uniref:glycosyltransferase family 4 protein n=1 Tax=Aromatoleum sp. TaxID=2307007 RepID=UPI002FCBA0AC